MAGEEELPFNGERLREVREARELPQAALGKAIGRSQGYISNLEKNYASPETEEVEQLESQLHVAPGTLRQPVGQSIGWLRDETADGLSRLLPYFSTLPIDAQRAVLASFEAQLRAMGAERPKRARRRNRDEGLPPGAAAR